MKPKINSIYRVTFEVDCRDISEDIFGNLVDGPWYKSKEVWEFARILMEDKNGDLIVEHSTGIKNTYPRISRVSAKYIDEYKWEEIKIPEHIDNV